MDEVQWEDQQKINEFSKLSTRLPEIAKKLKDIKDNKEDLEDLKVDVELVEDNDMLLYHFGEIFAFMRKVDILRRVDWDVEALGEQIREVEKEQEKTTQRMDELKQALYAKFGRENINLETM